MRGFKSLYYFQNDHALQHYSIYIKDKTYPLYIPKNKCKTKKANTPPIEMFVSIPCPCGHYLLVILSDYGTYKLLDLIASVNLI